MQAEDEFAVEGGAEAEDHFVAVVVDGIGGDDVADEVLRAGDAVEGFDKDFLLEAELGGIGGMAEGTPPAVAGPGAVGFDAVGGGFEDFDGAAEGKLFFLFIDAGADGFVGQGVVHKDDKAVVAGKGLAAMDDFFGADGEFEGGFFHGMLEWWDCGGMGCGGNGV